MLGNTNLEKLAIHQGFNSAFKDSFNDDKFEFEKFKKIVSELNPDESLKNDVIKAASQVHLLRELNNEEIPTKNENGLYNTSSIKGVEQLMKTILEGNLPTENELTDAIKQNEFNLQIESQLENVQTFIKENKELLEKVFANGAKAEVGGVGQATMGGASEIDVNFKPFKEGASFAEKLKHLDAKYMEVQAVASSITDKILINKGEPFSNINLPVVDEKTLEEAKIKVKQLEMDFNEKYTWEFNSEGVKWNGQLSLQRIFWQDPSILQALQDPMIVRAIIDNAKNKSETNIMSNDRNTFSSLMLFGMSSNQISFLTTATPNWFGKDINFEWKLEDSGMDRKQLEKRIYESPLTDQEIEKKLTLVNQAMASIESVLKPKETRERNTKDALFEKINKASTEELIDTFKKTFTVYNFQRLRGLVYVNGINSTEPDALKKQFEGVMNNYTTLSQKFGNVGEVLKVGNVSHALDPRHLAVALYNSETNKTESQENSYKLLDDMLKDEDPNVKSIIETRLKQLMRTVVESVSDNKIPDVSLDNLNEIFPKKGN